MIDERQEELASLYALDLLEGVERLQFETALARDPGLQALVRELREASAALTHTATAAPPPTKLKDRIMASIAAPPAGTAADKVIRGPFFNARTALPWAIAAGFAIFAGLLAQRYFTVRTEVELQGDRARLAELAAQDARQRLEATTLLDTRQIQSLDQQLATAHTQLGEARSQLADARTQVSDRDRQLAVLTERVQILIAESAGRAQLLAQSQRRIEQLAADFADLKSQSDIANLKIAALASMLNNSPQALAVAVWDPVKQEGVLSLEKMPPLEAGQKLELWVVEAKTGAKPVSAGVIRTVAEGVGRVHFKTTAPVTALAAFAMSREKDDGATSHATPAEVIMMGPTR